MKEESLNVIVGKKRFARWMTLPPVLILVALVVGPLGFLLYSSFFDWTLTIPAPPKFIWFKNYVEVLKDIRFWIAFKNTVLLMILGITTQSILGLILALLLNREFKLKKIAITILALPIMITPVVIGFNWRIIYHEHFGPLNYIIRLLGLGSGASWIADPKLALISIFIVDTWQWTPFVTLILLAGLQSIPRQVYEASNVDGASSWQIFRRVTLPLLRPMFVLVVLFRTIWIFKIFDNIEKNKEIEEVIKVGVSENVKSEFPFICEIDGKIYEGVIDKILINKDKAKIYDFKVFLKDEEEYKGQLNIYRNAVKKIFNVREVECYLVDLNRSKIIRIDF